MAKNNQIPEGIKENDIFERSVHIRVEFLNLHNENEELRASLATQPAFPDLAVVYIKKISERQSQVTKMKEVLSTATK